MMNRMRSIRAPRAGLWILAGLLLSVSGCLQCETSETVLEPVGKSGAWAMTMSADGISSGDTTNAAMREDFGELVRIWEGKAKEVAPAGHRIIERKVWLSNGRLMGYMKTRVDRVEDLFDTTEWEIDSLGYHFHVDDPDTVMQTNGKVEHREFGDLWVTWPPPTRRLELKTASLITKRGNLVPYYQAYIESTKASK